nr:ATP-binding protein [Geomonas sp. Red32]
MEGSELGLADSLWLLGAFGFLHGIREWLELGPLIEGGRLSADQILAEKALAAVLATASFVCLLRFGISLSRGLHTFRLPWAERVTLPLLAAWVAINIYQTADVKTPLWLPLLERAEFASRITFGIAGGLLAGYGLLAHSRELAGLSFRFSRKLRATGFVFLFYALLTVFSPSFPIVLPLPVELLRTLSAFLISYFIVSALNIFDVETRKKIEQQARRLVQAEKLTSLGQLAAGIAHEINNPLTNASLGIQLLTRKLEKSGNSGEITAKLAAVEHNIERASLIAQELLQFSRQQESAFTPLRIEAVVQAALTLMSYQLRGITVVKKLPPGLPEVMGDQGKLEQVFINILDNAVRAMPGGGTITLSASHKGSLAEIAIADTGVGIEQENLSRAFDPFFTTRELGDGTGLGLSICYGIIRQHGGSLEIASAVGRGTTLTVRLPVRSPHEDNSGR